MMIGLRYHSIYDKKINNTEKICRQHPEVELLLYGVIVRTEPEESEFMGISYEDVIRIFVDRLLSDEQYPLTIWRRCCSSVHLQTMSVETCNRIRELAGVTKREGKSNEDKMLRAKLDNAVNNWYLKGEISLSDKGLIKPFEECGI